MVYHGYGFGISVVSVSSVKVSCALPTVFSATVAARARHGAAQSPSPRDPWLFAVNCAASRCPSVFTPAVRTACDALQTRRRLSRRPCRSSGGHVHLCAIFYASQPHKTKRLNLAHCCFGTDTSACVEDGMRRPEYYEGAGYNPLLTPCMSGSLWAMPLWQSIQV